MAAAAGSWHLAGPGWYTFQIYDAAPEGGEVDLIDPANGAVYAEADALGPGTSSPMRLNLGSGSYAFLCRFTDYAPMTGPTVVVGGHASGTPAIVPVTGADLLTPAREYHAYVSAGLSTLAGQVAALAADVRGGNLAAAKSAWLPAHLTYERLRAAYGSFGAFDQKIDGLPDGLPGGMTSAQWTGFYRLEYGLWHGQSARQLTEVANTLVSDVQAVQKTWPSAEIDLPEIGLRTHEILENALQFQLSGHDDYGSKSTLTTTQANITGTQELLSILHPLLAPRYPGLPGVYTWLSRLSSLLDEAKAPDGQWTPAAELTVRLREQIDAACSQALEQLAPSPPSPNRGRPMAELTPPGAAAPEPADSAGPGPSPRRRAFLLGGLGAGAVGAVAGVAGGYAYRSTRAAPASQLALGAAQAGTLPPVPFEGRYQAGILPGPQRQTAVIAFNATAQGRGELIDLFQAITARARFLTAGGTPPPTGIGGPPSDSGVLGEVVVPDGLTVTLGVGSTLFDGRYGLASQLPARLTPMRAFPNDSLDPAQCGGDLILQLSAGNADVVVHAPRDIARHTRGGMQAQWRIDGFSSPPRPAGTVPRNMLGFMDGIANPDVTSPAQMDSLVWIKPGTADEPAWTARGSYFVVRLIRMLVEFWDRVDISEQENMIGRRRVTGYPLDATSIDATPQYAQDPVGEVIPLTAHIRLANPRTPQTASSRILRRAYSYDRGLDQVGNLDIGLVFTCFQQDIKRQFEAVQTRLIDEPLVDYISPFGGGYFLALPGVLDSTDYLGRTLLG